MCRRLLIHLQVDKQDSSEAQLRFGEKQAFLRLRQLEGGLRHETAFGRVAFAVPAEQLPGIQARVQEDKLGSIITELVKLDTPGKATVEVVILGDPVTSMLIFLVYFPSKNFFLFFFLKLSQDGHEICFVGEEGFGELSQVDPKGDELLRKAMEEDKSKEWFAKKGLKKEAA